MASSVSHPRRPWRFWETSCSVLMLPWLHPSEGGCQVKKALQQPWDSCCSVDCLFYPGGSFTPRSSKAIKCLWAFAPQLFWICLSPGKVEIPAYTFFRETGKNERIKGYRGWRSILLFWRLQKHEIALQPAFMLLGDLTIFLGNMLENCYTYYTAHSWYCRPKFSLLALSYVENVLQPVPSCCLSKSGTALNCFLWIPSLLIRTLVALIRTGCKHGWLKYHFVNSLCKDE